MRASWSLRQIKNFYSQRQSNDLTLTMVAKKKFPVCVSVEMSSSDDDGDEYGNFKAAGAFLVKKACLMLPDIRY